jgi:hypothetical protein
MSWKGKEVQTWLCYTCNQNSPYGYRECVYCALQNKGKKAGGKEKGKKGKSPNPAIKGKGNYNPYHYEQKGGETYETESPQKEKLKKMKQALKSLQGIEGLEERVESLKADIKEQQILVNQEQGIDRADQTATLLTELKGKKIKCEKYKDAMDFHHTEAENNARNHQTMDEDIGNLYEELAALGWDPSDTESEGEEDPEMDSLEYWEKTPKTRSQTGAKETTSQARARHAKNRLAQWCDISDEEQCPEERKMARRKAAGSAAADRRVKTERQSSSAAADRRAASEKTPALAPPVDAQGDGIMG